MPTIKIGDKKPTCSIEGCSRTCRNKGLTPSGKRKYMNICPTHFLKKKRLKNKEQLV